MSLATDYIHHDSFPQTTENKEKRFANKYEEHFALAGNEYTMEDFWAEQAKMVDWYKFPPTILNKSNPPFYRWFQGGLMNTSYNCIDRHAKKNPNKKALIYESAVLKKTLEYTYGELLDYVSRLADVLRKFGVQKGDGVIIYMPMIPEVLFSMQACARIGAVHSVVFGGFGAPELASRIQDLQPKVVLLASCGIEPSGVIDYKKILDDALKITKIPSIKKIVVQRDVFKAPMIPGEDFDFYEELSQAEYMDPVPVDGSDYLYVLYTSGTTGQPKGIVRENGGNAVALCYTMKYLFDIKPEDVYFCAADVGWVTGHSYIIYAPLLVGATTIIFEGKPVGNPDAGVVWRICEKYNVRGLYSSPTAVRAIRKDDPEAEHIKKADLSNLAIFALAGERLDIPAYKWLLDNLPKNCLLNDNYWQTETGWSIGTNFKNLYTFPCKPGSVTRPAPGMRFEILDEHNKPLPAGKLGKVCIKLPLPPSFMPTLYKNDAAFCSKYITDNPGYYFTGDAGLFDNEGYLNVTARVDDVINTAGHRLSTSQMEEVLTGHDDIVEAAVIGTLEEIKGEIPVGFVVLKQGRKRDPLELEKECIKKIRYEIGPVASFKFCLVVDKLPKTRSGKIIRSILRDLTNGNEPRIPPTIEDRKVVDIIREQLKDRGLIRKNIIQYAEHTTQGDS
jgi:propionyl-CoA synthetase